MAFTLLHPIHPETVAEVHLIGILFIVSRKKCRKVMTSLYLGLNCSNPFGDCDYSCLVVLGFHVADCGWSLDLSLSLLFWIGSYITPSKTTKDEVVLQYPSQRFTQNFGPPFCGEAQHDVRSKEEPLLSRGAERIWWPLWNSTWNRGTSNGVWKCLDNDIPICSYAKPRKHGSNKEHVVFTPTGITKRVKVVDIPCNVSSNWY